ncbi:tetrathionate reductase family octaheme c-type cytochrome [uncultured Draconibacterium sp.]|uniref:tetrathionate reductase family octaheme c-type cytochrome n=1 Tax=uncultured Draconibacterium sp. TaxID=1573823 RepID=UPI0025D19C9B|nr:tetrathionate reductase family octaheme c-type cytochrome [uncultured Draconibacterium sp.]
MKYTTYCLLLFLAIGFESVNAIEKDSVDTRINVINYTWKKDRKMSSIANHNSFEILQQDFENAHQVTEACISCHNKRDEEIMATSHWNWERTEVLAGKGAVPVGKKNILNNFCIGISGSEATCTRCHIGYGWKDQSFDFNEPKNIDCLVCHDNSGTYEKGKGAAGYPAASVNLSYVARNVGSPKRENCGVCHFWGGGGNNVKHGDLEVALLDASKKIDVHMAVEGEDMSCVDCHVTENHQMAGKLYALSSENKNRATCEQCHTAEPHTDNLLNQHNLRIACQTCHIPSYAKANSTKMIWDWSTAGVLDDDGNPKHENDADGNHNYLSIKGTFVYDDHVKPEYYWFNGIANHQLITDKIDTIPVQMNSLDGSYNDKGSKQKSTSPSKIWPVKVHRGKQIYDTKYQTLIQPKLWSTAKGDSAYWLDFNWNEASKAGMDYLGLPYSGEYDFVETEMYWPLNHMVAPKEESLSCKDCHTRTDSRLASLNDFYLPGRDYNRFLDISGFSMIAFILLFVFAHGALRILTRNQKDEH